MKGSYKVLFLISEDWYFWSHRLPLAQEAKRRGYAVLVATRVDQHAERMREQGFRVIPLNMQRRSTNPFRELVAIIEIVNIYRREKPDLVHQVAMKPVLYGSLAAHLTGVRHVVNALAGMGYIFTSTHLKAQLLRPVIRTCFRLLLNRKGSRLILQNEDDRALFIQTGIVSEDKICLIRGSGVDTKQFHPSPEPTGVPLVVLISRMLWDKGIEEFVEAAKLLNKRQVKARFVLVGDIDVHNPSSVPQEMLHELATAGLVEWWGKKENIAEIFSQSTIACLPSYREGLPKVLLEAAACGLPIVTTNVPGCREVVRHGENGLLVPLRSAIDLADALQLLLEDSALRHRMGAKGRQIAADEFAVEKVVAETMALYELLLPCRKILVTGADGFIGRSLCPYLKMKGWFVRGTVRKNETTRGEADEYIPVGNIDALTDWQQALAGVDTVVHLAARVHVMNDFQVNPLKAFREVNVLGTERLVRMAAAAGVKRFIFISSVKVNGEGSSVPYCEKDIPRPEDAYGISKHEAENLVTRIAVELGLPTVVLRLPLVYGSGVKANFRNLIKLVGLGLPLPFKSINNMRSFIYVGNLADAIATCATHPLAPGQTFLVSDGVGISSTDLIRMIASAMNKKVILFSLPQEILTTLCKVARKNQELETLTRTLLVDSSKIRNLLGWNPPFTFAEGIKKTVK